MASPPTTAAAPRAAAAPPQRVLTLYAPSDDSRYVLVPADFNVAGGSLLVVDRKTAEVRMAPAGEFDQLVGPPGSAGRRASVDRGPASGACAHSTGSRQPATARARLPSNAAIRCLGRVAVICLEGWQ